MTNCFSKMHFILKYFLLSFIFLSSCLTFGSINIDTTTQQKTNFTNQYVVVIDAGHGGKDPGNEWNGFVEKNIALKVALKVGKILEKHKDIKVLYTRKTDVFITLMERAEKANKAKADLFVSVHCNSFKHSGPHGTETYVLGAYRNKDNLDIAMKENSVIYLEKDYKATYDGFDPEDPTSYIGMTLMQEEYQNQSILLADDIQKEYTNSLHRFDRGVKKAGFLVIRETYMPSVLTEIGFLSNKAEGRYLNSKNGQQDIASAIANGIIKYKNTLNLDAAQVDNEIEKSLQKTNLDKEISFRVQIAAGSKPLETQPFNFNGLEGIERKKEDDLYKYYYGDTPDYVKIQELQQKAIKKGYLKAYIVAFKKGNKVSVGEALKNKAE